MNRTTRSDTTASLRSGCAVDDESVLSNRVERLLRDFERDRVTPPELAETVRVAISGSPLLASQLDSAISKGLLKRLAMLPRDSSASGEYHARAQLIKLSPHLQSKPGGAAFVLGHESQHALNSSTTSRLVAQFDRDVARTAVSDRDYTAAVRTVIGSYRWDEASSTLAGWNALIGYVRSTRRKVRLTDVVRAAPNVAVDFVIRRGRKVQYFSSLESAEDLTLAPTPENVEAVAQKYFDKTPKDARLGASATSDYRNYYAAWAVGVIAASHNRRAGDQPMRIDLQSLGLSRKIMEENGIDLHGARQQAYVDASTQPPTRDFFHHTIGTFRYVPPTPTGHQLKPGLNPAALEVAHLASLGFARPATQARQSPSGRQLHDQRRQAATVRNARPVRPTQSNSVT